MTQDALKNHELVSALADGQLRGEELARALEVLATCAEARATWRAYHLMGDVLRSDELAACGHDDAFVVRLQSRLQHEVIGISSDVAIDSIAEYAHLTGEEGKKSLEIPAANEPVYRWKLAAGFASLAAVSAIAWNVLGGAGIENGSAQLARVAAPPAASVQQVVTLAGGEPQVMLRDARLDALLAAHKQFGGTSALQMPAGFLRNATFEGAGR